MPAHRISPLEEDVRRAGVPVQTVRKFPASRMVRHVRVFLRSANSVKLGYFWRYAYAARSLGLGSVANLGIGMALATEAWLASKRAPPVASG